MKFGIARLAHETNTFANVPTELADFQREEYLSGVELLDRYCGTNSVIGGAIAASQRRKVELVPLMGASAAPGGVVGVSCFDHLLDVLRAQLQDTSTELDGVLLDLHGAMVAENNIAADEHIVGQVREVVGETPIAVVLDSHANVTPRLVDAVDIMLGPDTSPHLDLAERGEEAVELLARVASGELGAESHVEQLPLLIPVAAQNTGRAPMCHILDLAQQLESEEGVVAVSVFGGFPHADVPHAGVSVVAIAENDSGAAKRVTSRIASEIWKRRDEFTVQGRNVEEAIHDAMASRQRPIVLADLGDNPGGGAPGDGTTLLWALLDLGARNAVLAVIADEQAVDACISAGIDSRVEIPIGGRRDTRHGYPIDVRGKVKTITDGRFTVGGPVSAGLTVEMGRTVVLETEARHDGLIDVILTETRVETFALDVLRHVGIDPADRQIIALKSDMRYRVAFEPIAAEVYEVITPGITTPDPAFFVYRNVRRPIYPLDPL